MTALDGSAAAIERARSRADEAKVRVTFDVTDATTSPATTDGSTPSWTARCITVSTTTDDARTRPDFTGSTRPGARWHLYCFSGRERQRVIAPMGEVPEDNIRDTLAENGWRIDFLGPTTYLANTSSLAGDANSLPEQMRRMMPPEQLEQMQQVTERFAAIVPLLDGDRVHLPFTVVHAVRVD